MNYSMVFLTQYPSPATLLPGSRTEAEAAYALAFVPYNQPTSSPSDPQFNFTESSVDAGKGPSLLSVARTTPPLTSCSTWNNALSCDTGFSAPRLVADPSESSTCGAQGDSRNSAVVTGHWPIPSREQEHSARSDLCCVTVPTLTGGQALPASSHAEHVVSWYLTCWNAVIVNGPRKFVPQTIYQPHSQGDKERYVSLAKLQPPIIFLSQDSPEWGIPISYLLSKQMTRLAEGNEPAFVSCGPSIGIRVQWPGYQPCHKQVSTRDYTCDRRMINKAKLAKVVARCVKQFMGAMSKQAMQVGSDRRWRVGPLDIRVDDIILISLHHVSQGSWQPQLRLRRTIGTNVSAGP